METDLNIVIYDAALYLRLSKEDGDKEESDSIANQKELIREFLKSKPDIRIHGIRADDGYTGVNFERPAFQEMINDIKQGTINCVVVKDLSRFGRNYIETGRYIEKIFPSFGVRFIAVNDNYDSSSVKSQNESMLIPFKNLINDAYCRDISIKIRTNLEAKRKRGDFVGAFAPYGYKKCEEDKNKLEIDEEAAAAVNMIFRMYISGNSVYRIADYLNETGVLTPLEYKRSLGSRYYTGFKRNQISIWTHAAVLRVLKNYVYTGSLVQGKETTPNYKVKRKTVKGEHLWNCVKNTHDPIIAFSSFKAVQNLLLKDTRTSSNEDKLYPLSGIVKCSDCRSNMSRKTVPSGKKKYVYYVCSNKKYNRKCSSHCINAKQLEKCILNVLNHHIQHATYAEKMLHDFELMPCQKNEVLKRSKQVLSKKNEIQKYNNISAGLYEDYQNQLITIEEYSEMKEVYRKKTAQAVSALEKIQSETDAIASESGTAADWAEHFRERGELLELTREVAASLIDEVLIYEKEPEDGCNRIQIRFNYRIEFDTAIRYTASEHDKSASEEGKERIWLESAGKQALHPSAL